MCSLYLPLVLLCMACVLGAEPKRDRFGDPLPEGAIARLGSLRLRNGEPIFTAAYTAEGKTLVAVGASPSISIWDPVTGKLLRRVERKNLPLPMRLRCLSPDGKMLIADNLNVLYALDASSGAERGRLDYAQFGPLQHIDVSGNGKVVAAVHQRFITVWDISSGKFLHQFKDLPSLPLPWYNMIALTPDGKQLLLPHSDGSLHLFDIATGKDLRALKAPPAKPGPPSFLHLQRSVVSPDGHYLAFGGWINPLTVYDLATGKRLCEIASRQGTYFTGTAFAPNGRVLAVSESTGIRLFDVPSGKEKHHLPMPAGMRYRPLFSPDGRTLAVMGGFTIKLWDMTAERWLHPLDGHDAVIHSIIFFPDGKRLVSSASSDGMKIWDIASGQPLAQQTNTHNAPPLVAGDGECVRFALFNSAHRWDPRTGREEIQAKVDVGLSTNMYALSPDGRSLAVQCSTTSGTRQKPVFAYQLRLYDLKTNKFMELPGMPPPGGVSQMLFTPDSRRVAARCQDSATRLWDRGTGKLAREFKSGAPMRRPILLPLAFAADGRSFLTWSGGMVRICEIASCADRLHIPADPDSLNALAYAPDARFIACGQRDGRILVYSSLTGKQLAEWQGKQNAVHALAFSRDDRLLASGGANGTILIWKVPQQEPLPAVLKVEEADSLWQALGDIDAAAANRALAGLVAAPTQALPLISERLGAIGKQLERAQYAELIAKLDDDSFKVREGAMRELALAGADAADALREALNNSPSAEVKRRVEDLLGHLKKGGYSQCWRYLRAVEVLERIGTPQTKEVLRELAGKSLPPDLREEVQASLSRLGDKP